MNYQLSGQNSPLFIFPYYWVNLTVADLTQDADTSPEIFSLHWKRTSTVKSKVPVPATSILLSPILIKGNFPTILGFQPIWTSAE